MSYCKQKPGKFANIYTGTYNTSGLWSVIIALPAINLFQSELSAYPPQRDLAERILELEYYKYHVCCISWSRARIGHDETGR